MSDWRVLIVKTKKEQTMSLVNLGTDKHINEELNTNYILAYLCKTPDGTVLQCKNRHDYQQYTDKITGETYMIDGLGYYTRSSINNVPAEYTVVTLDTTHVVARELVVWGTRGKSGDKPLKYISVASMETDHIEAILDTQFQIVAELREFLKRELNYRRYKMFNRAIKNIFTSDNG